MTRPTNHLARGLTLIELVISMSIVVIVLAGITGAVMLAGQAVEANIVSADQSTDTAFGLSELRDDLTLATAIDDLSETGVTLTVPDRTGDGTDDTVIYTWESSGATLTRILNAEPKSITFASPCSPTMMWCGLRSRWTIPLRCTNANAEAISPISLMTIAGSAGHVSEASGAPSSMISAGLPSIPVTSSTVAILGCRRPARRVPCRTKRSRTIASASHSSATGC